MARLTLLLALLALCAAPCAGIDYPVSLKGNWQAMGTFAHPVKAGTCISLEIKIPQDATLALATSKYEGFTPHIIVSLNRKADDTCFVHTGAPCVGCRVLTEKEGLDHTCYVVATTFFVEIFNPGTTDGTYTYSGANLGTPAAGVACQDKDKPDEPCGKADVPACNVVDGKAEGGAIAGSKALGTCHCECFSGWEGDDCSVQTGASPAPPTDAPTDAPTDVPMTDVPMTDAPTDVPDTDAPPTDAPPTDAPPTDAPPTNAPPTNAPPTEAPPTDAPPTDAPPTDAPPTDAPPTNAPPTDAPPTGAPATDAPPTEAPPTDSPSTTAVPQPDPAAGTPSPAGPATNATAGPGAVAPLPANGTTAAPGGPSATATPLGPNATAAPGTGAVPASTEVPLGAAAGPDGSSGSGEGQGLLVVAVVLAASAFLVAVGVAVWVCCVRGAGGTRRSEGGDDDVYLEMMSPEEAVFGTRLHDTQPGSLQTPLSPVGAGGGDGAGAQGSGGFKPPTYDPEYDSDSSLLSAGRRSLGSESEMTLLPGTNRLLPY